MSNDYDEQIKQILYEHPLMGFSIYTDMQVNTLRSLGNEILNTLEVTIINGVVYNGFQKSIGLFWLWIIGAYEVIRTMAQAKTCFSEELFINLQLLKKRISLLRMPFAKQEYPGKRSPIGNEASVYSVDTM